MKHVFLLIAVLGIAVATLPGMSAIASETTSTSQRNLQLAAAAAGDGLKGQYFNNQDFTSLKVTRVDPTINFSWGSGSPASSLGADTFAVRWTGDVQPRYGETYTFYTTSDDGVRLWVNGTRIINNWTNHAATENKGTIALAAGQRYSIKLEYYESAGAAQVAFAWSSPSQAKQIVPQSQLYSGSTTAPTATPAPATATPVGPTATPAQPTATPVAGTGQYFKTLPPGSALPSDAACAAAVKRRPENKRVNATANATKGSQSLGTEFLPAQIASRVTGNFSGTTDEILQWTACKWGVDEDMVRAQAAIESWWRQDAKGDWTTDGTRCAPGHGLGADGTAGQCPESFGILQNRYPYEKSAWPGIGNSTAYNADTAYAIWRSCYEGYETWLNTVERGKDYAAGDAWGCMGRWFAGRWYTQPANDYIGRVQGYLSQRIWEQASFQEP